LATRADAFERFKNAMPSEIFEELAAGHAVLLREQWNRQSMLLALLSGKAPERTTYRDRLTRFERAIYEARRKRWLRARRQAT
jgi:hypothetical protein